jgi:hypothetical protein
VAAGPVDGGRRPDNGLELDLVDKHVQWAIYRLADDLRTEQPEGHAKARLANY